jgi:ABC-type nitrate/sulfonate/bicarbonate transport system substrate-binding protein
MRRPWFQRWAALVVAGMFVVAACSSGASTAPSTAPSAAPSTAGSQAPTEAPFMGTKEFTIGFTSLGLSSAPYLQAIKNLNASGFKIDTPNIDSSELLTQAVAGGQFAFGSGANNSVMAAIEAGANLKLLITRVKNEWTVYARNSITSCADLAGKKLAIHSEGAVSTAMLKNYINTNCPGTEPAWQIIPGSPNRLAALLADQIDASPLELGDGLTVDAQASDRFHLLASLANDLPNLQVTSIYVNGDFLKNNPDSVLAVVKAVLAEYKRIAGNADALAQDAKDNVADFITADTIDAAAKKYTELNMFPADGGLTTDNLQYTIDFFGPNGTGSVKTVETVDQISDLSVLQTALSELGQ